MKKENNKQNKKFGLLSMTTLVTGTVVGIGIFFKNTSVLAAAENSPLVVLSSWIIISVLILASVIAFMEISSTTENERGSISNWVEKFISKKASRYTQVFFTYMWIPIIIITISMFGVHFLFDGLQVYGKITDPNLLMFAQIGTSALVVLSIFIGNKFGKFFIKAVSVSTMAIKLLPLLLVVILGVASLNTGGAFNAAENPASSEFNPILILAVAPSILFAFDGFMYAANLQQEAASRKTFKRAMLLGMLSVVIFYVIFAVVLLGSTVDASFTTLFSSAFGADLGATLERVTYILIFISAYGVASNFVAFASRDTLDAQTKHRITNYSKDKKPTLEGAFRLTGVILIAWFALFTGASYVYVSDGGSAVDLIDYLSNFIIIGGFTIYVVLIMAALGNRFTNKIKTVQEPLFKPAAIVAIVGFGLIVTYFMVNTIRAGEVYNGTHSRGTLVSLLVLGSLFVTLLLIIFNELSLDEKNKK